MEYEPSRESTKSDNRFLLWILSKVFNQKDIVKEIWKYCHGRFEKMRSGRLIGKGYFGRSGYWNCSSEIDVWIWAGSLEKHHPTWWSDKMDERRLRYLRYLESASSSGTCS
jgi:hypothetical protein